MHKLRDIINYALTSLLGIIVIIFVTSCTQKDLHDTSDIIGTELVTVKYIWENEEILYPEGMANLFYHSGLTGSSYWRSDFPPSGGTFRLPRAFYDAVCFNNDTENVIFSNIDSYQDFNYSTPLIDTGNIPDEKLPFPPQKLYSQPDIMWSDSRKSLSISSSTRDTVSFTPRRITRDFHIEMADIENLRSAIQYYAVLSDMTASFRPSAKTQEGPAVSMGGFMTPIDESTLSSTIRSFGMSRSSTQSRLAIYLWLADGQHRVYNYDVTDRILQAPDSMNVIIRVKGPSLPYIKPGEGEGGSGGGLDVGVDDWDIIDIEL